MLEPIRLLDGAMRYQFPQLATASEDISTAMGIMNDKLSTLNTSLDTKLANWDGGSRGSYTETKTAWNTAAANIEQLLSAISRAIIDSSERMAQQELANAMRFQRG